MSKSDFLELMGDIAEIIGDRPLDTQLEGLLNELFPADGKIFEHLGNYCREGEAEGWLMNREAGGIKFGRAVKPGTNAGIHSVDVVRMNNVAGPHHIHTTGEIGAVLPISGSPVFDAKAAGWYVYPPGSDHHPTISGGAAYVVYLLPGGAIEFTGK